MGPARFGTRVDLSGAQAGSTLTCAGPNCLSTSSGSEFENGIFTLELEPS